MDILNGIFIKYDRDVGVIGKPTMGKDLTCRQNTTAVTARRSPNCSVANQ